MKQTEYWIRPGQGKVIALLHGIGANNPQSYWQAFLHVLANDEQLRDYGLFVWKYPTHIGPATLKNIVSTITKRTLRETAPRIKPLGAVWNTTYHTQFRNYQEVILVCHSMGGLVVKSWIIDTLEQGQSTSLETLRHITFYATPHNGAPITTLANWNKQLKDMQLNSPFIEDIGNRWHEHVVAWKEKVPGPEAGLYNRYIPHLVIAGLVDHVVPSSHATIRGMPLTQVQGDHSEVIQPIHVDDTRYKVWQGDMQKEGRLLLPPSGLAPQSTRIIEQTGIPAEMDVKKVLTVFFSYASEDEKPVKELEKQLSLLRQQGCITGWFSHNVGAGEETEEEIVTHLSQARIILLLISPDFLASEQYWNTEVLLAMQKHKAKEAHIIPILLRPIDDWKSTLFAPLQALPTAAKAITTWSNQDDAWVDVAQGIRKALEEPLSNEGRSETLASKAQQSVQEQKKSACLAPFAPVWNVPYRYTFFFTGRDHLLEQLFTNFASKHDSGLVPIQALTGLGGLGKTQTAVAYAYRYRKQYQTVLWTRAETEEDLVANFKIIAELLKRPAAHLKQRESLLASMQEWFRNTADWLLILDNADNLAMVEPFLPRATHGHLLLTSRVIAMGALAQPLPLNTLTPDDGALCILRRANSIPWAGQLSDASPASVRAAQELSQLMDGLPLALEQAGAYIETTGRSVSKYLDLYRHYRPEIQRHQYGVVPNYREPVAFAWNISREIVKEENPVALELLHLCAYLFPDAIPYELFTKGASILGSTLRPVTANELALDQAIALLRKHSLIKNEVDRDTDISRLIIHPVLQEILKDGMDPRTQHLWAERAVRIVAHALPFVEWQIMQAHVRVCLSLIGQWKMSFSEADLIRQRFAEEHE